MSTLDELRRRHAAAEAGGGVERQERQHRDGKLSARERIDLRVFGATVATGDDVPPHVSGGSVPGTVLAIDDAGMLVACGAGGVRLTAVHPAGRRRLTPREWAAGRGIAIGDVLG